MIFNKVKNFKNSKVNRKEENVAKKVNDIESNFYKVIEKKNSEFEKKNQGNPLIKKTEHLNNVTDQPVNVDEEEIKITMVEKPPSSNMDTLPAVEEIEVEHKLSKESLVQNNEGDKILDENDNKSKQSNIDIVEEVKKESTEVISNNEQEEVVADQ